MRYHFVLLFGIALSLAGCGAMGRGNTAYQLQPWDQGTREIESKGGAVVLATQHEDIAVVLDSRTHAHTQDVIVRGVETATGYMIETSDPVGRYLPTISFKQRNDTPVLRVDAHQVSLQEGSTHRYVGEQDLASLRKQSLGVTTVTSLHELLSAALGQGSLNIVFPAGQDLKPETLVEVFTTHGSMTVVLIPSDQTAAGNGFLMSSSDSQTLSWEGVSTTMDHLAAFGLTNLSR